MKNVRLHMYPNIDRKIGKLLHKLLDYNKEESNEPYELVQVGHNSGDNNKYYKVRDEIAEIVLAIYDRVYNLEIEKYKEGLHHGSNLLFQLNKGEITTEDFLNRTGRESWIT